MAGNQASLGGAPNIARLAGRRARINDALTRAEGERKTSLEAELATIDEQIAELRAALAAIDAALGGEA